MFVAVAMLALACAGMMYRTTWWADGIAALTLAVYATTALCSIGHHGRQRTVLLSFCVIGFLYYHLANDTISTRDHLPTTVALAAAAQSLDIDPTMHQILRPPGHPDDSGEPTINDYIAQSSYREGPIPAFTLIGHCVFSWIFAVLAAWFAGWMYDKRE